jgi:hypothetical protein
MARTRTWLQAIVASGLLVLAASCGTSGGGGGNGGGDDGGDDGGDGSNTAPTVTIDAPAPGASFASGATVAFSGSADDAEDGDLTASLAWSSDRDGSLGTGGDVSSSLSDGAHTVTASVEDGEGLAGSAQITVSVGDGGDGGDGGGTGTSQIGFLVVSETDDEAAATVTVTGSGGFWESDPALEDAFLADPWSQVVDTCDVFDSGDLPDDPFDGFPVPDTIDITFVDAGTPVTISATGDPTYLELERTTVEFGGETSTFYASTDDASQPGPLAAGLAASIPGGDFPAVASAAFPSVDAFALAAPADPGASDAVSTTTEFTWTPGTGDGARIVTIEVVSFDLDSLTTTTVSCYAEDDGSFTFPAAVQTELGAGFTGSVASAARESVVVQDVGDAVLLLTVERSISYDVSLIGF